MKWLRSGALGILTHRLRQTNTKPNANAPVLRRSILRLHGRLYGIHAHCQVAISTQGPVALVTMDLVDLFMQGLVDLFMQGLVAHAILVLHLLPCLVNQKRNQQPAQQSVYQKWLSSRTLDMPTHLLHQTNTKPSPNAPVLRRRILLLNGHLYIHEHCQVAISTQGLVAHVTMDPEAHALPVLALFSCLVNQKKNQQPAPRSAHNKQLAYYLATFYPQKKAVQCLDYAAFLFNTEQGKEKSITHRFLSSCLYMSFT